MFTGIIDHCAHIIARQEDAQGLRLVIDSQFSDLILGESIAVNGACLTVADINGTQFSAHCSPETLVRTNLALANPINLERSLKVGDRLGGHFVSGHVDQVGQVRKREMIGDDLALSIDLQASQALSFCIHKGSITINGVSLTINAIHDQQLDLMVIPHTQQHTNLAGLKVGDCVNVEFDMLAKMVANRLEVAEVN